MQTWLRSLSTASPFPEPARNLLGLSRVKLLAREVGATSVTYRSDNLTVTGVTAGGSPPP